MIESILVRRLSAITLFLAVAVAALALALGSPRVAGGIAAGAVLGLLPIVSWSYLGIMLLPGPHSAEAPQELIERDRNGAKANPLLFGVISLGKLGLYGAALYVLVGRNLVHPLALAGALLVPGLLLAALAARREVAR